MPQYDINWIFRPCRYDYMLLAPYICIISTWSRPRSSPFQRWNDYWPCTIVVSRPAGTKQTIRSNMIGFSATFRHSNSRRDLRGHPACRLSSTRVVGTNNIFATNTTWQRKYRTYTYSDPGMSSVLPKLDRIYSITMSISLSSSQLPRIQTKDSIDLPQNCRFISFPFCYSSRIITTPRTCRIISIGLCSKHIGQ